MTMDGVPVNGASANGTNVNGVNMRGMSAKGTTVAAGVIDSTPINRISSGYPTTTPSFHEESTNQDAGGDCSADTHDR